VSSKPRSIVIGFLVFALIAGYFVVGHYLYKVPIGLDQSGYLAGDLMHAIGTQFKPDPMNAMSGVVLLVLSVLAVGAVGFFVTRAAVRKRAASIDPARRSFLSGAGAGAGVAIGGITLAAAAAALRGFFGFGVSGDGWAKVGKHINDKDIAFTHPEWKDAWKGATVQNFRRFGRTDWNISDVVLGTGRIRDEEGEKVARAAIERGVNYIGTIPLRAARMRSAARSRGSATSCSSRPSSARRSATSRREPRSRTTSRRSRRASVGSEPITSTCATSTRSTPSSG